ncbi:ABC transporter permease [Sinorhizobium medicae]|uniref:Binding-protein-dependent transport systems inner membrane component n=7 Tax=Sinorhizobium medicae TaxID=110321 RepID=A6UAV1_SINMW|nr:binding-protein-dependent transport systems inner membrane component [Sinorhizobium medicae WSM419]PLT95788.1 ABC transporter permease [Sinorhizobium medicae]PLU11595.1 ABC transporter permease [Sinorhizobium medicae]PLU18609.1 ABC transporter permease [Sinorhizobium medicae]PLU26683.1 ABC transporter permease [Sinorhizobium medicae]
MSGVGEPAWLLAFVCGAVFLLSVLPLIHLGWAGLKGLEGGEAASVLLEAATFAALRNTLVAAAGGMVISLVVGALFAFVVALTDIRGKLALSFAFMLPMMIPPQVTALAWVEMSGPSSPLLKTLGLAPPLGSPQPLYSLAGIALLLGVQHAPLVFLAIKAGLATHPRDGVEAARLSGASPWRVFRDIVLPLACPALIAGGAIAFISGIGNFGIPAILGIPASIETLPTLIFAKFASFGSSTFGEIAVLSTIIASISAGGLLLQQRALKGRDYRLIGLTGARAAFTLGRLRIAVETLLWGTLALVLVAPLLALVASSLVPAYGVPLTLHTVSLQAYGEVLFRQTVTLTALKNSVFLASAAAVGLLVIALPAGYLLAARRGRVANLLAILIEIPYALPGIVLAVAFILAFAAPLPVIGVSIYGTIWIILAAYLSSFFAVSLKPVMSAFLQMDPSLEEAARLAGAGFLRRMRDVLLPLVAPAAGASVILVFLIAANELTVSALLWSAGTQTLGVAIFNLDDSGSSNLASALSVLVVAVVIGLMATLEVLAKYLPEGVLPWRN